LARPRQIPEVALALLKIDSNSGAMGAVSGSSQAVPGGDVSGARFERAFVAFLLSPRLLQTENFK
jgi:hypothetical protein